ncbi:MAG: rhomboid family intramembrane serine protease [Candidatus Eremiobacteraeota bacterium]|nr:rhomboid family intramembrane serine protease [Candidatus Eremiobacteraeota bacterium]MCW5868050.1 rhomboid family intramembrane serine protease [Candidatus Eremiobacteraeota bacterium]
MMKMLKSKVLFLFAMVALLWCIEGADFLTHGRLDRLGALHPRTQIGLAQIFSSPFLHGGWQHLLGNTLALIPLGILMLMQRAFVPVMLISILVGGLGSWVFSTGASLGFSGVLFGFMGFLLARGLYTRRPLAIAISLITFSYFSGIVWQGLIPHEGISWSGHFWGFVGGVVAARQLKAPRRDDI